MDLIKLERDYLLDKIYECRGKIDYNNYEALDKLNEIIDIVVMAEIVENKPKYPKIRFGR